MPWKTTNKRVTNISKADRDLLIIAQTGVVNYEQLWLTGFHGKSREAYRVAIQELKEKGFVDTVFFQNRRIAIMLTPKGREHVKNMFDEKLLMKIARQMEKSLPSRTSPQFLHRMNTNTFYCGYLSAPKGDVTIWNLEYPYENHLPAYGEGANRSDGYLETPDGMKYFVEQDNQTQRSAVINEKINQYIMAGIFSSFPDLEKNILVFCVDTRLSEQKWKELKKKDSMRLYRIFLKLLKLWRLLEYIRNRKLYLRDILTFMGRNDDKIAVACIFTEKECEEVVRLFSEIKELESADFATFEQFKDNCRRSGMDAQERTKALDAGFDKRCKNLYLSLLDIPANGKLRECLGRGMCISLLPLYDIKTQQPHLMIKEFRMEEEYLKCLAYMGLNTSDPNLQFHLLYKLGNTKEDIWFRNVFVWPHALAVWEDISGDIGGHYRVSRFFKQGRDMDLASPLLFVLLVRDEKEATTFYEAMEQEITQMRNGKIVITFLSKNKLFFQNLMVSPYGIRKRDGKTEIGTVFLETEPGRLLALWEDE